MSKTTVINPVQVQASMFKCNIDVTVPGKKGEKLTDNQVGSQLLKERARGDCYQSRNESIFDYLKSKDAIVGE